MDIFDEVLSKLKEAYDKGSGTYLSAQEVKVFVDQINELLTMTEDLCDAIGEVKASHFRN